MYYPIFSNRQVWATVYTQTKGGVRKGSTLFAILSQNFKHQQAGKILGKVWQDLRCSNTNPGPAEPKYALPLQTSVDLTKPTDLDLNCCHSVCELVSTSWIK